MFGARCRVNHWGKGLRAKGHAEYFLAPERVSGRVGLVHLFSCCENDHVIR